MEWVSDFPDSKADFFEAGISDHSSIVVSIYEDLHHGLPPFKFFNFMPGEDDFLEQFKSAWSTSVRGNSMFIFVTKVKRVKAVTIHRKNERFTNVFTQVESAMLELRDIQKHIQYHPLYVESSIKEKFVIQQFAKATRYEESIAKQKFRVKWMSLGDSNTHLFNNSLRKQYNRNNILILMFRDNFDDILKDEDRNNLVRHVIRDEIFVSLSSIDSTKSPGPDGFSSWFSKFCWSIVGDDFTAAVQKIFKSDKLLRSKIIYLRIKHVLGILINANQSAFNSGRPIQDNVLLARDILRNYHRPKGASRFSIMINGFLGLSVVLEKGVLYPLTCELKSSSSLHTALMRFNACTGLEDCIPLIDNVTNKVKSWKFKSLTYGGRLLLIKIVLNGMCPQDASWSWRNILGQREEVAKLLKTNIGNGVATSFLTGNWKPNGRLVDWISGDVINNVFLDRDRRSYEYSENDE
ncbi:uncharacterized protein LOC113334596 [Papaver somniferum]|uniref:uncharacterized protein LOC113334596 n=1 Tax=Papaver somniferum TaxID=3469 RepID=UPI000E7041F1|nr:uncharacterized protein LOC113334596 [Papaver somniferum]